MKLFGLTGFPLGHSFSPSYFSDKFRALDLKGHEYRLFPLKDISQLRKLVESEPDLSGLNVTIPHKQSVLHELDQCSEEAKATGAVNTIRITREGGKAHLKGFNTDIIGFRTLLRKVTGKHFSGNALVLGNGGASQAVQYVLKEQAVSHLVVSGKQGKGTIPWKSVNEDMIESVQLIINTTPLGMYPEMHGYPEIPYQALNPSHILIDLVYNPETTLFMEKGQAAGCSTSNGYVMLISQAKAAWEIWNTKN